MSGLEKLKKEKLNEYLKQLIKFIREEYPKKIAVVQLTQEEIAERCNIDKTKLSKAKNYDNSDISEIECRAYIDKIRYVYQVKEDPGTNEGFSFRSLKEWTSLADLAGKLALNLVDVSTSFTHKDKPYPYIIGDEKTLKDRQKSKFRERIIAVVGAGASHAATNGLMPLTPGGVKFIRDQIKNEAINKLIDKELERLKVIYKLDTDEFETQLLACSKYSRKEVLEALYSLCKIKYVPALSYEILAHMLKHRLLDIIINFNYDEILDNALEEELSYGKYHYIYSDGHCPNEHSDLLINNRLKKPVYVKPHGTISHRSSLRFTREDYFAIPFQIRDTLIDLFEAKVDDNIQDYLPLNLIIIGYSLQSVQFTEVIKSYLEKFPNRVIRFWFFDKKNKLEDFHLDLKPQYLERIKAHSYFFDLNQYGLEEYMKALWAMIENNFKEPYKPKGIERHLFVHSIFNGFQSKIIQQERQGNMLPYLKQRFFVELAILLMQSDGILNANQIAEDRAGKYFHLLKKNKRKNKETISLRGLCRDFSLNIYKGFVWDTFISEPPFNKENEDQFIEDIFNNLARLLGDRILPERDDEKKASFINFSKKIRKRNRLKIAPNYRHPHKHLFSKLKEEDILNTGLSWIYKYRDVLIGRRNQWDVLLGISEKGRFLNRGIKRDFFRGKKLELILSTFDIPEIFPDLLNAQLSTLELLSGKPLFLPWWLHNQHLVLFLKRTTAKTEDWRKNWRLVEGFYFESRMLSGRINPVHVKYKEDKETLLYIFANYWYRARHYTNCPEKNKTIPIIADDKEMDRHIRDLLALYEDPAGPQV